MEVIKTQQVIEIPWQEIKLPTGLTLELFMNGKECELYSIPFERILLDTKDLKTIGEALIKIGEEVDRVLQDSSTED